MFVQKKLISHFKCETIIYCRAGNFGGD